MTNPSIFPAERVKCDGLEEELNKRTISSKTYNLGNKKHRFRKTIGPVHYKEGGIESKNPWQEIDLTIRDEGDYFVIDKAPYDLKIFKDKIKYSYESKQKGRVDVELKSINDVDIKDLTLNIKPEFIQDKENRIIWKNAVDDIDFFIDARPAKLSLYKVIKKDTAPKKFTWNIFEDTDALTRFRRKTGGMDNTKHAMEINNSISDKGTSISGITGKEYRTLEFTEEWTGRVSTVTNNITRIKEWTDKVDYPTIIDADVEEQIESDEYDGLDMTGYFGTLWMYNIDAVAVGYPPVPYTINGGLFFPTIPIPQGSTIDDAKLIMVTKLMVFGSNQGKLYAHDVDDANPWANGDLPKNINPKTTAYKLLNITTAGTKSISITSIVQEIISRDGWASNNDVRFALLNDATESSNFISFYDYGGDPNKAAILEIDYTAPPVLLPARDIKTTGTTGKMLSIGTGRFITIVPEHYE